jgi:threonine dehydrogenase-like Zn-dependent dehydrogenase
VQQTFDLEVNANERVGALGKTGTGKTFLMTRLLTQLSGITVIVVDTKHAVRLQNFKVVYGEDAKGLKKALRHGKVIYRPGSKKHPKTKPDDALYNLIWSRFGALRKPDCVLYIDEMAHITSPNTIPEGLQLLLQAGREVNIGVWWSGQQGTGVNNWAISQTEKIMVFRLPSGRDRQKMASFLNDTVEDAGTLRNTEFYAFGFSEVEGIQTDEGTEAYMLYLDKEDNGAGAIPEDGGRKRGAQDTPGGRRAAIQNGSSGIQESV